MYLIPSINLTVAKDERIPLCLNSQYDQTEMFKLR